MTKWIVTWPDLPAYEGPPGEHVYDIAWGDSIWKRANNADRGWEITLSPLNKK